MAEVAASIISLVAFGTSVAKKLYETADIMRNANQQIRALAKHVTQFTAVLNHMGQVLKTEKTNCSKEVLRDIRKIKHSCKRTFKDIENTVKARRFQPLMWLFRRTKAMELEARLDSQQSMLQCMIHTLTVSKLSHMDSRSKEDSSYMTGLKVEIKLLTTLVKENYDKLMALRRAEQSTEAEARYQPVSGDEGHPKLYNPHVDDSTFLSNPIGESNTFEPPRRRSSSPTRNVSESDHGDSSSEGGDDNDDFSSIHSRNDHGDSGPNGITPDVKGLISGSSSKPGSFYNGPSDSVVHRESDLLLQMVPYRPRNPHSIRSDHLLAGGHDLDNGTETTTEEATKSVRLLLDRWTAVGSAPIANILDEEAAKEKIEAESADRRRASDPRFDRHRWPISPGAEFNEPNFGFTHEGERYGFTYPFQDDDMPLSSPPTNSPHRRERSFWTQPDDFSPPPSRYFGGELLTALRSTRGGIHYVKSNQFKQVHFVDHRPIYTCALVPPHLIPYDEHKFMNTELGKGLIRREALDLLAYSYTELETGKFSISGNLRLGDIEELVRLSYQALERNLEKRSKTVIKERGWSEAVDVTNRRRQRLRSDEPWPTPHDLPSRPEFRGQDMPPYDGYFRHHPHTEHEETFPDESTLAQAPFTRLEPRRYPSRRRQGKSMTTPPPISSKLLEQDAPKPTRPEVRFTFPREQLVSDSVEPAKEASSTPAKPDTSSTTDNRLQILRQKLERLRKRKDKAEKDGDLTTAADLTYYGIPEVEADLEKLLKERREEQEKTAAPVSLNEEEKSRQAEVQTESEGSDDEGGSEVQDLYE